MNIWKILLYIPHALYVFWYKYIREELPPLCEIHTMEDVVNLPKGKIPLCIPGDYMDGEIPFAERHVRRAFHIVSTQEAMPLVFRTQGQLVEYAMKKYAYNID